MTAPDVQAQRAMAPNAAGLDRAQIVARFLAGESARALAAAFGVHPSAISYHLKRSLSAEQVALTKPKAERDPAAFSDLSWMDRAICSKLIDFAEASLDDQQAVCAFCPVRTPCAALGMVEHPDSTDSTVFGGLTARQRRSIRSHPKRYRRESRL